MLKVKIYTIGKNKEPWLQEALDEYQKRLTGKLFFDWIIVKNNQSLEKSLEKLPSYIVLDPNGQSYDSEGFSKFFFETMEQYHCEINLVIGGAEGLLKPVIKKASHAISLSKLTFTHQITRIILLEQIYRAFQIQLGTNYHK
ncbi:MAG TPA: 23S rRNA (pseudouridine(1915)-N(3))-methyltransferase RlmH [Chlamydiales bacterium]|nr:23S rRNA (pseudouridine(1915)-N(3))-methyltransferase RlmH [Chlamydiales bacterium]